MVALLPVTQAGPAPTSPCGDLEGVPPGSSSEGGQAAARPDHSAIQAAKPALSKGAVDSPLQRGPGSILTLRPQSPGLELQGASWDRKPFVMEKLSNLHPRESNLIHPGIQHWSQEPTPGGGSTGFNPSGAALLHSSPVLCLGVSCWVIRSSLQAQLSEILSCTPSKIASSH